MNRTVFQSRLGMALVAVSSVLIVACATAPIAPSGSAEVRGRLTALQRDANLGSRAPVAIKEADAAVRLAETPEADKPLAAHRVFMADRKVETARALAEAELAEFQRTALTEQRERARLDARTREADAARNQARIAQAEGDAQKLAAERARTAAAAAQAVSDQARGEANAAQMASEQARRDTAAAQMASDQARRDTAAAQVATDLARSEANAAQLAAANSQQQAAELQRQLNELNAKVTDRGVVLTLGDVLFTSGEATLKSGTAGNLGKLAAFLNRYPERTVLIEGHTDSAGAADYNQGLSERRAESVKSYLVGAGVASARLSALGKGEAEPIADNESATGRQQNRRVQVIISNPQTASR